MKTNPQRHSPWGLAILFTIAGATVACAHGKVTLSWDRPATATHAPVRFKSFTGPGPYELFVTLTGQSAPVGVYGISLRIGSGRPFCDTRELPVAWRFDGEGCQAGNACLVGGAFLEAGKFPAPGMDWITDLSYDPALKLSRVLFAEAYQGMPELPVLDPSRTYTLGRFRFDLAPGCTGESDSIFVVVDWANWVDADGYEWEWSGIDEEFAVMNASTLPASICLMGPTMASSPPMLDGGGWIDPDLPFCDLAVPAQMRTWGSLKASYR